MVSSVSEASAVTELRFFSKGDVWSVIITFLFSGSWNIFHTTRIQLHSLIYKKSPFMMELIILLMKINKTPKKIEDAMMMETSKRDNEKFVFRKWLSIRQVYVTVKIR